MHEVQLSPRSALMGGQLAPTLSKTHIFYMSFTPMALAWLFFSAIRRIFGEKTVFKTRFFDHPKGQFLFRHRGKRWLNSVPPKAATNLKKLDSGGN